MTTQTNICSPETPPRFRRRLSRLARYKYDPFKRPEWRWLLAKELAGSGTRTTRAERAELGPALRYLRDRAAARGTRDFDRLRQRYAALCSALRIHDGDEHMRAEVESRLLAQQPLEDIAERVGITDAVITTYNHYFFDLPPDGVGEDWLQSAVFNAGEWLDREPTEVEIWKVLAHYGGVLLLDVVINDYRAHHDGNPQTQRVMASRARFLVKDRAAHMKNAIPDTLWLDEAELLFPNTVKDAEDKLQLGLPELQFEFLRYAAGFPPTPAPGPTPEPSMEEICHAASKVGNISEAYDASSFR